jgi:hypothetical protein
MDFPCYRCGHTVEEGRPFCPQCGAPQIRVVIPEAAGPSPATMSEISAGPGETKLDYPILPVTLSRGDTLQSCALAAGSATVLMFLGLTPLVAAVAAGFLSVVFLRRRHTASMQLGAGARLGSLSGMFLFFIAGVLETLVIFATHRTAEIQAEMLERIQQAAARYPAPEVQPFLDFAKSPNGFTFMLVGSLIFGFLAFLALGAVGGALGAALFGRRSRP